MFTTKNLIRMHDIDMVGILYFPRQFRLVHEALEDFMSSEGCGFAKLLQNENFVFVIVRCESDYLSSLRLGDKVEVHVFITHIGTTSFTIDYEIYKEDGTKVGTAKTIHVCLKATTRTKIPIPPHLMTILKKHVET